MTGQCPTALCSEALRPPCQPLSAEPEGLQMKIKMDMMLEGCLPKGVVRFYPETRKAIALPKEEEYFRKD